MSRVRAVMADCGLALLLALLVPVAVLAVGAPIALLARLLIEIGGRL